MSVLLVWFNSHNKMITGSIDHGPNTWAGKTHLENEQSDMTRANLVSEEKKLLKDDVENLWQTKTVNSSVF